MLLYKLEIENFYSIRERQVIDLTIAPNVPDEEGRYAPIFPGSRLRAPKVVAVYGANGSGKTTVLRALQFLMGFVGNSSQIPEAGPQLRAFQDEESRNRAVKFACEFGAQLNSPKGKSTQHGAGICRYELEFEEAMGKESRVIWETLRQRPDGAGKWQRIFERDREGGVKGSSDFSLPGFQHLVNTLRPNVSVLSSFSWFQHPEARLWQDRFRSGIFQTGTSEKPEAAIILDHIRGDPEVLLQLNRELNRVDIGVEEIRFKETPSGHKPFFKHAGLAEELDWESESHGTQSFVELFPWLYHSLEWGKLCVIDEVDSAVHPMVIEEILRWFYDNERNPKNGQIWFTCHSASLLENLNKEEVVLTEKDRQGRTTAYSLMDVKDLRRDDNLYRKYLSGVLGGVPRIG